MMTAEKVTHTPGPWGNRYFNRNGKIEIHTHTHVMCHVMCREIDRSGSVDDASVSEAEANARLITAAPELLEACQAVLESLNRNLSDEFLPETRDCLRAAIAKATGE